MGGSDAHRQILRLDKHSPSEAVFPAYLSGSYQPPLPTRRSSLPFFSLSKSSTSSIIPTSQPSQRFAQSQEPPAGLLSAAVSLSSPRTALGAIFPAVVCTVSHFTLPRPLHITRSLSRPFSHSCHFMSRPCSHTQLYCIIPLGHTLDLTLEPQAQEHTCHNTVSFPHICVSDSHDITPVRRPSLTSSRIQHIHSPHRIP